MAGVEVRTSCSIDDLLKCQEEINRELFMFIMLSIMDVKNFKKCVILFLRFWSQISVALFLDQLKGQFVFFLLVNFFFFAEAMSDCGHLDTLAEITTCINDILTGDVTRTESDDWIILAHFGSLKIIEPPITKRLSWIKICFEFPRKV